MALRFGGRYEPIEGHGGSAQTRGAPSVAAHLSHVRVDRETGEVEVLEHVIAQDVGRALNPALVEGQMRGGAAQGIGWALYEQLEHDEDGRLLTGSFLDYAIPRAENVPEIDTLIVEVPAPDGPYGAKGIGEAPVVAAPAAVANAVAAALGTPALRAADDAAASLGGAALVTAIERARTIVDTWNDELRRELPEHPRLFDAHTHLGNDIDGMVGAYDELIAVLDRYGFEHAFTFCLDEPDREPAFSRANERTLAHADALGGPADPLRASRSHDHAARRGPSLPRPRRARDQAPPASTGVRAQRRAAAADLRARGRARRPDPDPRRPRPSADRRGPRGARPRNEGVQLIVAHAGIADMAELAGRLGGIPGVFFDTSVWSGLDLLDLYRQVSPEQVLYASDYPYGRQPNSLLVSVRTAKLAGFDDKQLRLMLGGSARRIAEREPLEPLSRPRGPSSLVQPLTFARIHQYISMAVPMLWLRQKDAIGAIGLAVNASRERANGQPEAVRADPGAPHDRAGALARVRRARRRGARDARSGRRSSSSTSRTWSRSRPARSYSAANTRRGPSIPFSSCSPRSSNSRPEPATRSRVVELTSTSAAPPIDMIRAATCTAMPRGLSPEGRSTSPVCTPARTSSSSSSSASRMASPHRIARAGPSKSARKLSPAVSISSPSKRSSSRESPSRDG